MRFDPVPAHPAASDSLLLLTPWQLRFGLAYDLTHYPPSHTTDHSHINNRYGSQTVQECPLESWLTKRARVSPSS